MASVSISAERNPLLLKLESVLSLSEEERDAILALPIREQDIGPRQDIVREGERPTRCFAILDGVVCAFKTTGEAKRQIIAFHLTGDMPDLESLHLRELDIGFGTLSACKLGFIEHEAVRHICARHPRITGALWRETLVYASIGREWITNVGRRQALSRAAHLLCEFVVRLHAVGLAQDHSCELPLTQEDLADALGVSMVHANRVLQALRKQELINFENRSLTVLDWDRLTELGDFDPGYLHLRSARAET